MAPRDKDWIKIATFLFLLLAFFGIKEWKDVPHGFWSGKEAVVDRQSSTTPAPVSSMPAPPSLNILDSIKSLSTETRKEPITLPTLEGSKQDSPKRRYDLPGGGYFDGTFENGKASGRGSYTLPDGNRYEGPIVEGLAEGSGTTFNKDGSRFESQFLAGRPIGKGLLTFNDGTRLEGTMIHVISPVEKGTKSEGIYTFTSGVTFDGFIFRDDDNTHVSGRGTVRNLINQKPSTRVEVDGRGVVDKDQFHGSGVIKTISSQQTVQTEIEMAMAKSGTTTSGYLLLKNPDGSRWKTEIRNGVTDSYGTYTFPDGKHSERRKIEQRPF